MLSRWQFFDGGKWLRWVASFGKRCAEALVRSGNTSFAILSNELLRVKQSVTTAHRVALQAGLSGKFGETIISGTSKWFGTFSLKAQGIALPLFPEFWQHKIGLAVRHNEP